MQPYLECLAFRLDTEEGSICYTGDSGPSDSIVELAKGCDMLIHMNHYFSGTEPAPAYRAACGNHRDNALIAKRAGVKTLVLTHLLAQIDQPGDPRTDRPRNPGGLRGQGGLGRGPDAPGAVGRRVGGIETAGANDRTVLSRGPALRRWQRERAAGGRSRGEGCALSIFPLPT